MGWVTLACTSLILSFVAKKTLPMHTCSGNYNCSQSFISALAIAQVELSIDLACGLKRFLLVVYYSYCM